MPVTTKSITAIVPAAGVGKRMQAECPKQYLPIGEQTILEHTLHKLAKHPNIVKIVVAISPDDEYFTDISLTDIKEKVTVVSGGKDRVDSVLNALKSLNGSDTEWVLVHDAARPCITQADISSLISCCIEQNVGGILATPVRDTMKRGVAHNEQVFVKNTEEREQMWHALTPQMFPLLQLKNAIEFGLANDAVITDEASAIEFSKHASLIIEGRGDNIKVTRPDDLALAEFILKRQQENKCE